MKKKLVNAALTCGVLILCFTLGECAARLMPRMKPWPRYYPGEHKTRHHVTFRRDERVGWLIRPNQRFEWTVEVEENAYVADEHGFRTYEDPARRRDYDAAPRKIVFAGDSFTFGTGVDYADAFPALVEVRTASTAVRNVAMPGFGVDQIMMAVEHLAIPAKPDLIVVAFIDNDLSRSLTAYREVEGFEKPTFVLDAGELRPMVPDDRPGFLWLALERHSWLWTVGRTAVRSAAYSYPISDWYFVNAALFSRIVQSANAASVPLLLVRLPLKKQKRFRTVEALMAELGADYLDLNAEPPDWPNPIHFEIDSHINREGHRYVAEQIHRRLPQ